MESGGAKLTVAASLFYKANYHDIGRWKTKLLAFFIKQINGNCENKKIGTRDHLIIKILISYQRTISIQ
jgi:hypothetical protein